MRRILVTRHGSPNDMEIADAPSPRRSAGTRTPKVADRVSAQVAPTWSQAGKATLATGGALDLIASRRVLGKAVLVTRAGEATR